MVNVIQKQIIEAVDEEDHSKWKNWRWHLKHRVTRLEQFEELLGIDLPSEMRGALEETISRFPMAVTPYYLSLIDPEDYLNDPVLNNVFLLLMSLVSVKMKCVILFMKMKTACSGDYTQIP